MRWTKIKNFVIGQSFVKLRGADDYQAIKEVLPVRDPQQTKPKNQETVHGLIAAGHDQRSSMTGGLMGNGNLLG